MDDQGPEPPHGALIPMVAIAGVLSVFLFIYLVCALLRPEWFV
jgi:K+-transporting ATPase KdpF subunit